MLETYRAKEYIIFPLQEGKLFAILISFQIWNIDLYSNKE